MSQAMYDRLLEAHKVLSTHRDRPEPLSVSVAEQGIFLTLWCPGGEVTGLLAWADLMERPAFTANGLAAGGYRSLNARGVIDGVEFTLSVSTRAYVPFDSQSGDVRREDLVTASRRENPLW